MKDIAPELLEKIKKDFEKKLKKSETIKAFREKVKKKTATYKDANDFAIETGELLADAFQSNLSKEILPDGKMYYNIADRVIRERLEHNYDITAEAAVEVQKILNKLGIGPQGFGGKTTAIGLNIETMPTHIAGMPCAVNINCHVTRHKTEVI